MRCNHLKYLCRQQKWITKKNFIVTIITTKLLAKFKEWNSEKKVSLRFRVMLTNESHQLLGSLDSLPVHITSR